MAIFIDPEDALRFLSYLYEERQLSERTVNEYKYYYQHLDPSNITQEYVTEFIMKHKNHTVIRGMMLNYLKMKGITGIKFPERAKGNKIKRVIRSNTLEDIKKVAEHLYSKSYHQGLIFDLVYQGALRRVEIPTIKIGSFRWKEWSNDMDNMCKLVVTGKGAKERVVLINPETAEKILNRLLPNGITSLKQIERLENSSTLLFARKDGNQLTERYVYDVIKSGSKKVLGRDIRPHELRHNRATELQKRGIEIHDIKNYLGHSRIGTTEIYLHKSGEESLATIEKNLKEG